MACEAAVIRLVADAALMETVAGTFRIGVLHAQACLQRPAFEWPAVVDIGRIDIVMGMEISPIRWKRNSPISLKASLYPK